MEHKNNELNARAKLDIAVPKIDAVSYNEEKQEEVNQLRWLIERIDDRKTKETSTWSKVQWQWVGNKFSAEFFKSIR